MRIVIADDDPQARSAIELLLQQEPGVTIVAQVSTVDALLPSLMSSRPDIVLLDGELPGLDLGAMCRALAACRCATGVLVLSGRPETMPEVLAAGADAFVYRGEPPEILLSNLHTLATRLAARKKNGMIA